MRKPICGPVGFGRDKQDASTHHAQSTRWGFTHTITDVAEWASRWSFWLLSRRVGVIVRVVPVQTPFANVADHIVKSRGIRLELPHGCGERVAVVPRLCIRRKMHTLF